MHTAVKQAIIAHAHLHPNEEVCGLVYQDGPKVYAYPCSNITIEDRAQAFEIDPQDYIAASQRGNVCAVYHGGLTHTNEGFSEADLESANEFALPLHALSAAGNLGVYVPPSYQVDLTEREWCWGVADCYEIVRTYYRQEREVFMRDYERDESFVRATPDAITRHVEAEGFHTVPLSSLVKDDVLLFTTPGGTHAHHLGVYLGGNRFLHHPLNMLSRIDDLDGAWLKRVTAVLRYQP